MTIRAFEGARPQLGERVYVAPEASVIGDVAIAADSSIWPMSVVRGDINRVVIGARTNIQDGCVLHVTHAGPHNPEGHALWVGDEVTVGHQVILHGCTIHDRCLIGMGSTVMDGAVVHPEVILGAGSLVTPGKELASGYLWLGRPARRIRALNPDEIRYLRYSADHYVELKDRYRSQS